MDARGRIQVDSARWAGRPLESGVVRAAIRDGVITVDTMNLSLPGARVTGGGRLPVTDEQGDEGELRASLSLTRADVLAGAVGPEVLAVGEAGVDVTASGSLNRLTVEGDARITALLFGDIRVQGVEVTGTGRRTAEDGWVEGEAHLMVDRLQLPTAPVQRLDVDATLESDGEVALSASAVIDQRRDAELSARVDDMAAPGAVTLERFSFRADQDRWTLAEPTRLSVQNGFRVDSLRLSSDGQTIRVAGELPIRGPLDLRADVQQFEIATVADLLGFPDLRGRVSGSLDVGGTAAAPIVESSLRSRLEPRGAPAADVSATLDYREGTATVDASAELDAGGALRGRAELPMELSMSAPAPGLTEDAPIRMRVRADSFPANWFEPWVDASTMRNLEGRLDGEMRVTGTPTDPSLDGSLTLRRGGVRFPALGTRYEGIVAGLGLSGTRIAIDSARAESGDGTLTGSGSIEVEELSRPEYDLRISADRFEVMNTSAVQASVSGQIDLEGPLDAPRIVGSIDVEGGDLYLGDLVEGANVEDVRLSEEEWEELARVFGYERPGRGMRESPFMETATLDLDVRLGRASWLRQRANPELAVQFTGELSVEKQPGDSLRLAGTVEAVPDRSWVEQFGRRFSIEEGQLNLRGAPEDTRIEATAQYVVPSRDNPGQPEVIISLAITGTPGDLQLELSSTPTLEASDMVSYLVTGRPASQALSGGGEGTLSGTGRALALGRLSSAVEAYAREEVGLDVVEITTTGLEGVTLLAGRYVSPDLYLGIRQPISLEGSSDETSEQAPTPEVELEFQAIRWLLLNVRAGGRSGVEFFVRTRIAYE